MKKAWIENNTVRDICQGDPATSYHPDIAVNFSVDVPDGTLLGATLVDGDWANPVAPEPVPSVAKPPMVTVITYKLLFTSAERIAVKASADPVIIDLQELMNDPRTTHVDLALQSISDALDYMTTLTLIAPGRKAEILTGVIR